MGKRNAYRLLVDNPLRNWLLERLETWKVAIKVDAGVGNQPQGEWNQLRITSESELDVSGTEPSSSSHKIAGFLDMFHRPVFLGVETLPRTPDDGKSPKTQ
jgi:hypothetical protein